MINDIDIDNTINSGQVFLWKYNLNIWYGVNGDNVIAIEKNTNKISTFTHQKYDFFRTEDNITEIIHNIKKDKIIESAIMSSPGLRILRQDPFQCVISFITSSNSNIQKIKTTLLAICNKFGAEVNFCGQKFKLFPSSEALANASMKELADCGLGYRSRYVKSASYDIFNGMIDLNKLKSVDYHTAIDQLTKISGIGQKIADCILLFSLDKLDAFPLDRWMIRCMRKYYNKLFQLDEKLTWKKYEKAHEDITDYFGAYSGYAQQFLFKMERDIQSKKWL